MAFISLRYILFKLRLTERSVALPCNFESFIQKSEIDKITLGLSIKISVFIQSTPQCYIRAFGTRGDVFKSFERAHNFQFF